METKVCTKCKEEKPLSEFNRSKRYKTGYKSECRVCSHEMNHSWYSRNKHIESANKKARRASKTKEQIEHDKNRQKEYKRRNIDKIIRYHKQYYQDNKQECIAKSVQYKKIKYNSDPVANLSQRIRSMIRTALKERGYSKNTQTYKIVGLDLKDLKEHLYETFRRNYSRSLDPVNDVVHIDHIIPLCTAKTEEDVIRLNHYTNLQLLLAEDNLKKSDSLPDLSAV